MVNNSLFWIYYQAMAADTSKASTYQSTDNLQVEPLATSKMASHSLLFIT